MYFVRVPKAADLIFPRVCFHKSGAARTLYLTFDDAPSPATPQLLHLLSDAKVKATFFLIGKNIERYPSLAREIAAAGHALGNHSFSHPRGISDDMFDTEVRRTESLIEAFAPSSHLFRFPYGKFHRAQPERLRQQGLAAVMWSLMPGDFDTTVNTARLSRRLERATAGDIIVLHDGVNTIDKLQTVLPRFIAAAQTNGFAFSLLPAHFP